MFILEALGFIFLIIIILLVIGFYSGAVRITKNDKPWPFRE